MAADIMGMDELETFVLDFLAYRREQRANMQPPQSHAPKRIECRPESSAIPAQAVWADNQADGPVNPPSVPQARDPEYIPPAIGRGWPHYKGSGRKGRDAWAAGSPGAAQAPVIPASQNDIIPALAPIVAQVLTRFGPPTSPKALDHLINQVIASAIKLPPVSESMQTAEIKPWGRVALLQTVIELLIRVSTM